MSKINFKTIMCAGITNDERVNAINDVLTFMYKLKGLGL